MTSSSGDSTHLGQALQRFAAGDAKSKEQLIQIARERLQALTSRMLKSFPAVNRWEQTDDVLQSALVRLDKALSECPPKDRQHFLRLSTLQIRRTLLDLSRRYQGPEGLNANHATTPMTEQGPVGDADRFTDRGEPDSLAEWAEFHEAVGQLPEEEREVFDLLWYQGLSQNEAAEILGVVDRTVRRRWISARLKLQELLA